MDSSYLKAHVVKKLKRVGRISRIADLGKILGLQILISNAFCFCRPPPELLRELVVSGSLISQIGTFAKQMVHLEANATMIGPSIVSTILAMA